MSYNLDFFIQKLDKSNINYKKLLTNKNNVIQSDPVDVSIIIGTKDRDRYLKKCLDYLKYSLSQSSINAKIIVVQHDKRPTHRDMSLKAECSYVFLPLDSTDTDGLYSRALAYNVGVFANVNAEYFIFHDIDTLFPHDYFKQYEEHYLKKGIKWLQNFNGKSLYCMNKDQSEYVFNLNGIANLYAIPGVVKGGPGAAGGSLTCSRELFFKVGGYDPEVFWGWAPEDSMFWTKLLCMVRETGPIRNCHTYANELEWVYADNPPLRLYHLFHDPVPNTKWGEMQEIHDAFWALEYEDKMKYIEKKKALFKI
jgi:hypothetical protein